MVSDLFLVELRCPQQAAGGGGAFPLQIGNS
jgi:hypothetical protein